MVGQGTPRATGPQRAICIDLDGTLLNSDLLIESVLALLTRNPLYLFLLPIWLVRGKAPFKREIATRVALDPATLPYDRRVLSLLDAHPDRTRVLCTASDRILAEPIARHLGLFDAVVASDGQRNLAGRAKADALIDMFGERGYDYAGNARVDSSVWASAHGAWAVNCNQRVREIAESHCTLLGYFPPTQGRANAWIRAMRPHQWLKNLLLLVPLLAAHRLFEPTALQDIALAFAAFCLCASSTYLINDLLDLQADRAHPTKRDRPFSSGELAVSAGLVGGPLLGLAGLALAWLVSPWFLLVAAGYYALTLAYSLKLKRIAILDVVTLAGLYSMRIVAGATAIGSDLSFWLLAFSMFIFLSLALVKRYTELRALPSTHAGKTAGRDYRRDDLPVIGALGSTAGYLAILVLAMYINSPESLELYRSPRLLWALCPLFLYWISRVWLLASRGEVHEDPILFALRDGASRAVAVLTVAIMAAATLL